METRLGKRAIHQEQSKSDRTSLRWLKKMKDNILKIMYAEWVVGGGEEGEEEAEGEHDREAKGEMRGEVLLRSHGRRDDSQGQQTIHTTKMILKAVR